MSRSLNGLSSGGDMGLALLKPYNLGDLPNVGSALVNLGFTGNIPSTYSNASSLVVPNDIVAYDSNGRITAYNLRATLSLNNNDISVVQTTMGRSIVNVNNSWAGLELNATGPGSSNISIFSTADFQGPGNFLVFNYTTAKTLFLSDSAGNFKICSTGTLGMINDADMTITSPVIMNYGLTVNDIDCTNLYAPDGDILGSKLYIDQIFLRQNNDKIYMRASQTQFEIVDSDIDVLPPSEIRPLNFFKYTYASSTITISGRNHVFLNIDNNKNAGFDASMNIFIPSTIKVTDNDGCRIINSNNIQLGGVDNQGNLLLTKNILAPLYMAWHLISGTAYSTTISIPWSLGEYLQPSTLFSAASPTKILIPVTGIYAMFCTFSIRFVDTVSYTISLRRISDGDPTNIDIVSEVYNISGTRSMSLGTQAVRLLANDEVIVRMTSFNGIEYIPRLWTGHLIAQLS